MKIMELLIDAGNQRIKWATSLQLNSQTAPFVRQSPQNEPIDTGAADLPAALERAFAGIIVPEGIRISSVAGARVNRVLDTVCKSFWGRPPFFMESAERGKGLVNQYDKPSDLGVDRWLAMIGARELSGNRPVVVIDAGTAVTIDYVDARGVFDGGVIFPGIATMIYSLNSCTGQLRATTASAMNECLSYRNPKTQEAVENGVMLAVVSAMDRAIRYYKNLAGAELQLTLTGGDAQRLAAATEHEPGIVPDLVLMGLLALAEEYPE